MVLVGGRIIDCTILALELQNQDFLDVEDTDFSQNPESVDQIQVTVDLTVVIRPLGVVLDTGKNNRAFHDVSQRSDT